jgi:hypothetical protein
MPVQLFDKNIIQYIYYLSRIDDIHLIGQIFAYITLQKFSEALCRSYSGWIVNSELNSGLYWKNWENQPMRETGK